MKNRFLILFFVLTCVLTVSCGVDKGKAEEVANAYFEAIKVSDFNTALTFYSDAFFEKTPKDKAYQALSDFKNKYGELVSYKQTKWSIIHSAGDEKHPKGNTYVFKYDLTYTKYAATADLTLFQPDSDNSMSIQGYNIKSSIPLN
jgi:hypothetical protein